MSKVARRRRRRRSETGAIQILEEAFHLLRTVDLRHYWILYLGLVPFALALMYFVADMSRRVDAKQDAALAALTMAALYFWMRFCQAKFCAGLWDTISPGLGPRKTGPGSSERRPRAGFRQLSALWVVQAFHGPLVFLGLFFAVPLGWIVAALENASVLAFTRNGGRRPLRGLVGASLRYSHHEWAQNHGILLVFLVVALLTWVNLVGTCLLIPIFAKSIFGIESVFSLSPIAAVMNTSFLLGSVLLTWMVISPMMKAAYTLRCFYAESKSTGADLLSRLAACRGKRARERRRETVPRVAALGLATLFLLGFSPAETTAAEAEDATAREMRARIDETMSQKKYQWRLPRGGMEAEAEERGWLAQRLSEIAESVRSAFATAGDWIEDMMDKLGRDRRAAEGGAELDSGFFRGLGSTLSIGLVVLVLGLVAWLAFVAYRKYRGSAPVKAEARGATGPIDLESEDIVATQLPEDEWLRLAREQIAKGDARLAVRALFLATLAHLGDTGLLRIARFKSNRDYVLELALRARQEVSLREAFRENTALFERAWYGLHRVDGGAVEHFMSNHETIARESGKAAAPTSSTVREAR